MPLNKVYRDAEIPSWCYNYSLPRENLIDHIKYLTHNNRTLTKQLRSARYRYRKAENQIKELKS